MIGQHVEIMYIHIAVTCFVVTMRGPARSWCQKSPAVEGILNKCYIQACVVYQHLGHFSGRWKAHLHFAPVFAGFLRVETTPASNPKGVELVLGPQVSCPCGDMVSPRPLGTLHDNGVKLGFSGWYSHLRVSWVMGVPPVIHFFLGFLHYKPSVL